MLINGKCCTKTVYRKIYTKKCDPCEKLQNLMIYYTVSNGNITFYPSVSHDPYYIYKWEITGGPSPYLI